MQGAEQRGHDHEAAIEVLEGEHAERCSQLAERIGKRVELLNLCPTTFLHKEGHTLNLMVIGRPTGASRINVRV